MRKDFVKFLKDACSILLLGRFPYEWYPALDNSKC